MACCKEFSNITCSGLYHKRILPVQFLGTFAKLWKATISFVMSVCPSVRPQERLQLDGFLLNWIFEDFSKICRVKFKFHWNRKRIITGTIHEDRYTFLIISHSVPLKMKNVSERDLEKMKKTHFLCAVTFSENRTVYEILWKNIVEWGRPQMVIFCMCITCW